MGEAPSERPSERRFEEVSDYVELKAVFTAIEEFLRGVIPLVKDFLKTVLEPLDGAKLGKEIAEMYRSLKESGMSEEMIGRIIDRYLEKRLEELPSVTSLLKAFSEALSRGRGVGLALAAKEASEIGEKLREVAKEVRKASKEGEEEKRGS